MTNSKKSRLFVRADRSLISEIKYLHLTECTSWSWGFFPRNRCCRATLMMVKSSRGKPCRTRQATTWRGSRVVWFYARKKPSELCPHYPPGGGLRDLEDSRRSWKLNPVVTLAPCFFFLGSSWCFYLKMSSTSPCGAVTAAKPTCFVFKYNFILSENG